MFHTVHHFNRFAFLRPLKSVPRSLSFSHRPNYRICHSNLAVTFQFSAKLHLRIVHRFNRFVSFHQLRQVSTRVSETARMKLQKGIQVEDQT
jgi:hypothetical protein